MNDNRKTSVQFFEISSEEAGQRLDNYLFRQCKGVPKSHIYRIIRSGEVRVNKGRSQSSYKTRSGDVIRLPPLAVSPKKPEQPIPAGHFPIIYEDGYLLIINKPAGVAVHGGSGISFGVIEQLRRNYPDYQYLELAHRLDRETSGLLILAKKRSALTRLHDMQRAGKIQKFYLSLALGHWPEDQLDVRLPLKAWHAASGEKYVKVDESGLFAHSVFSIEQSFQHFTLLKIHLLTGRTHQIRVHQQHFGHPIAGDERYGIFSTNKALSKQGLKRMFLHATALQFTHPITDEVLHLKAPLPAELNQFLETLS